MMPMPDMEERIRSHMRAERRAVPPRPGLEARVLHAVATAEPDRRQRTVFPELLVAAAMVAFAILVGATIVGLRGLHGSSPARHQPPPVTASPRASVISREATRGELTAIVSVGTAGIEQTLGLADCRWSTAAERAMRPCFEPSTPLQAVIEGKTAYFLGQTSAGHSCIVYLAQGEGLSWAYVPSQSHCSKENSP